VVIGNDLQRRKFEVVFVSRKISTSSTARQRGADTTPDEFDERWLRINIPEGDAVPGFPVKEIEEEIVEELVKRHTEWIGVDSPEI